MEKKFREELGNAIPSFIPDATIHQLMIISLFPESKHREKIYNTLYDEEMSSGLSKALKEWHKHVSRSANEWGRAIEPLKLFAKNSSARDLRKQYPSLNDFVSIALSGEKDVECNWDGNELLGAYLTVIQKKYADLLVTQRPVRFDTRTTLQLYHERAEEKDVSNVNVREMAHLLALD